MSTQILLLIILPILAFLIGMYISYLILNSIRVSRSLYDELKEKLGAAQNELDTQKALVLQFSQDKSDIENRLISEQELNRAQEKQISSISAKFESLDNNYKQEKELNKRQQVEITNHQNEISGLGKEVATFTADNRALIEKLASLKDEIIEVRKASEVHFESIANRLLEEKSQKFSKANKENIEQILTPLKERIKAFEGQVVSSNKESISRHSALKEMLLHYNETTQKIGEDANNLAKALKGDFKKQGNWGEIVLKSLLDKSGLQKDREYFIQKSEKDAEGKRQRPDVIIELPDNKKLIVDSKVSLVAYDALVSADNKEDAEKHQKNHSLAIKKHILDLSAKNYHDLYQVESPDFVFMFIPIDTAFSVALGADPTLYEFAFSKNIIIVSASTLLATLKTVETIWKNDNQNKFAMQIADEAGKMYDKFVNFVLELEKLGGQIDTVQRTYESSMKKLSNGRGHLLGRAEKIKALGANTNNVLPAKLLKKIS